ncbi:DUF1613-domain-containing protein [Schizophyllum commune H4-8]|nr:DUF1613-domain-containing protein [Schizophyllum commune H4-8]KAI5894501.1 DUF1613-domain-containing protein [Schizophyllum commune H4-8]
MAEPSSLRPRYNPTPCSPSAKDCLRDKSGQTWTPLLSCPAGYPQELFETSLEQMVHHPEYNSTLILRSECLSDKKDDFPEGIPALEDLTPTRCIRRKLLPRRPGRDSALEQYCTFYRLPTDHAPSVLVLTPIVPDGESLPYYHPAVRHLAFRYIAPTAENEEATLRLEIVPLPETPTDVSSRLYRTGLALLETAHRYGWGALTQYKKRVHHDCLVPREPYQDLYLVMRERHRHLVDEWQESTDPLKHVFEDIGIATYLMLLWKYTYAEDAHGDSSTPLADESLREEPWKKWPRPPGGFVDLGCGNGLLTHILASEGYAGHGFDVRARTSWSHYPSATQARLRVHAFDPTATTTATPSTLLPPHAFLIGNHADELTPWIPVLATLHAASGYLSIPCCAWAFDTKYQRSRWAPYPTPDGFVEGLNLGGGGAVASGYSMYRVWLASLSLHCGWEVETEALRIPSTRNWAIVGRKRVAEKIEEGRDNAARIVEEVRSRGSFAARRPEGKAGEH